MPGRKKKARLLFRTKTLSPEQEQEIEAQVMKRGKFGPISEAELKRLGKKFGVEPGVIVSIRSQAIQSLVMREIGRIRYLVGVVTGADPSLKKGISPDRILRLSRKLNFPPVMLYNAYLQSQNGDPDSAAKKEEMVRQLEKHDWAFQKQHQQQVARAALEFEEALTVTLQAALKGTGVEIRRQEDLVEEQKKVYGRAVATPDILFSEPVLINGQRAIWIDAKNYYATHRNFIRRSLEEQAAKYNKHFGPGAFVFRYGCSSQYRSTPEVQYLAV